MLTLAGLEGVRARRRALLAIGLVHDRIMPREQRGMLRQPSRHPQRVRHRGPQRLAHGGHPPPPRRPHRRPARPPGRRDRRQRRLLERAYAQKLYKRMHDVAGRAREAGVGPRRDC